MNPPPPNIGPAATRREFLKRGLKAGAGVAATAALGAWLLNRHPPGDFSRVVSRDARRYFGPSAPGPAMAIATGRDRAAMLQRALAAMGGMGRFITGGDKVLVKVNAAFATPAFLGATTNPELLTEIIRQCRAAGAASVVVTDNPINAPESCFELTGIGGATRAAGADLYVPGPGSFRSGTLPGGHLIRDWPVLDEPFSGITKLIGVAPVKSHHRAGASMTMKNWYGLLGGRRNQFHQHIHSIVSDFALMMKPTLVILDGMNVLKSNGPTGGRLSDVKPMNTIVIGTDMVAVDAYGYSHLLERDIAELTYLHKAHDRGLGNINWEDTLHKEVNA